MQLQKLDKMKTKTIFILTLLILFLSGGSSIAQTNSPIILSLEECKKLAFENNFNMKNANDKIEASKQLSRQAFTNYFPNISAAGFTYWTNRGALQYTLDIPLGQLGLGNLGLGDNFTYDIELLKRGTAAGINLVQPIFMGGRIVNGNKLAHVGEEVSQLEQQRTHNEISYKVEEYYWKLATLNAKKGTLSDVIEMLDTLTAYVQSYVDAGVTTMNELLQVKLKRNQMQSNMVDLDNGINLVKMALAQTLGEGPNANIDVNPSPLNEEVPTMPLDLYVEPEKALLNTPDYRLLNSAVKASELQERIAVGENLPTVAGGAGYFYEHLLGQNHNFGALYITVAIPITDWWGGSHAIKKRKIEKRIAENTREDMSQMLIINMTNCWNDIKAARDKITIAIESISQSKENLRLNKAYYEAGIVTLTDLLEAQTLYKNSSDEYIEAYGNFMLKTLQYKQATGQE